MKPASSSNDQTPRVSKFDTSLTRWTGAAPDSTKTDKGGGGKKKTKLRGDNYERENQIKKVKDRINLGDRFGPSKLRMSEVKGRAKHFQASKDMLRVRGQ